MTTISFHEPARARGRGRRDRVVGRRPALHVPVLGARPRAEARRLRLDRRAARSGARGRARLGRGRGARRGGHREGRRRVPPAHRPRPRPRRRPRSDGRPFHERRRAGGHRGGRGLARPHAARAGVARRRRAHSPAGRALPARRRRLRPAHVLLRPVGLREDVRARHDSRAAPARDNAAAVVLDPNSDFVRLGEVRRASATTWLRAIGTRPRRSSCARSAAGPSGSTFASGLRRRGAGGGPAARPDPGPR